MRFSVFALLAFAAVSAAMEYNENTLRNIHQVAKRHLNEELSDTYDENETLYKPGKARKQEIKRKCVPGNRFPHFCNNCTCNDDAISANCTALECPSDTHNENSAMAVNDNGKAFRAKHRLHKRLPNRKCVAENHFWSFCDCTCNDDGERATCNALNCPSDAQYEKDNDVTRVVLFVAPKQYILWDKEQVEETHASRTCVPVKVPFKFGNNNICYKCNCSEDGTYWTCAGSDCSSFATSEPDAMEVDFRRLRFKSYIEIVSNKEPSTCVLQYCQNDGKNSAICIAKDCVPDTY